MESVLNIEVSCFANYKATGNPKSVSLLAWLTSGEHAAEVGRIRATGDIDERKPLKALLPGITPSGTFSYRAADKLIKHSGLLQFDIDLQDNRRVGNYGQLKELVCQSRHVAYCGLSVSGTGIWGLIPVAIPTAEMHKPYFRYIQAWFAASGITIDEKPASVASLRGYSCDPDAYFNHGAKPLSKHMAETPAKAAVRHAPPRGYIAGSEGEAFNWCVRVKDEGLFVPGNRNGWLTRLVLMCNDFGISRQLVESECVARFAQEGFGEREVRGTIRSIYTNHAAKHGTLQYTAHANTPPSVHLPFAQSEVDAMADYPADWDNPQPLPQYPASQYETRKLAFVFRHAQTIADFASAFDLDMSLATIRDSIRESETPPIPAYLPAHRQLSA